VKKIVPLLFLFGPLLFGFGCKKEAPVQPLSDVYVLQLNEQPAVVYKEWVGNMEGSNDTEIRAQVKGYLLKIVYKEGSTVQEGDILFEIDPRDAKAEVGKAKSTYRKTLQDMKRMKSLVSSGAVSRKQYDDAREAFESAKSQLDKTKLNLEFTSVKAPISGVAGISLAKVGDLVGEPGTNNVLTTVSQLDSVKINFSISEQMYLRLLEEKSFEEREKERQERGEAPAKMQLILANGNVYPHRGRALFVDRQVNTATGTITIQAEFPNPDKILRPGLFSKVRVPIKEIPNAILVPQRSIRDLQGINQVALLDDQIGRAHV